MFLSKLKEAMICLKAGRVTLPYPFKPAPEVPDGFRGKVTVDVEKCIGCGGCANVCPSRLIIISDQDRIRTLDFFLERCTFCGRCAEVCPEDAVEMTKEFETSTDQIEDLRIHLEIFMATCSRCGRCFPPPSVLDKMMVTGMRTG